jgi:hypothetical protein
VAAGRSGAQTRSPSAASYLFGGTTIDADIMAFGPAALVAGNQNDSSVRA